MIPGSRERAECGCWLFAGLLAAEIFSCTSAQADDALAIFRQRITPILSAKNPSSCSECHLSGVDLKNYIGQTQDETFASLRDAGLIDVKNPGASKILKFIARKPDKPSLVSDEVRQQEYEAFRAWIAAAVTDPKLAAAKTGDTRLGPQLPDEVIRHARTDRVLASFIENVWSEVGRCAACHSPDRNQKQVRSMASRSRGSSWAIRKDARPSAGK
jgi:mono/diheme cytochrome c family protein